MGNSITRNASIIVGFAILIAGFGYYTYLHSSNPVAQNNENSCKGIVSEEVISKAQTIEDHKLEYVKVPKKILFKDQYIGPQFNYLVDGKTLMIEQLLNGVVDGERTKSYLNYYLQSGKIFYIRRDYRQYATSTNLNDIDPKAKLSEISDFFLGNDQKVCVWYSNQKKRPNNAGIDEMINYFISGL